MSMAALRTTGSMDALEDTPPPAADKVNILIVDDLPEKILVYETILEDLHQNLIKATSGEEALKLVLKHEFAVILLDVNMPGMDGFETASLIRSRKKSSKTPIIFLTAFNDEVNAAQGYASGAVDYLPTPVVPEILKAKIRVFIELFQMRQQAASQAEEHARRQAAEESARRKDEFLATLAHELRNPLAPLRNALYFLQRPDIKADMVTKAHQMMERQLQHMVRLVDDLMDVSRITRGKIELRMENVALNEALESAIETARPLIEERQHKLNIEMPDKKIRVRADLVRLSQIFANLLNNAAKYTDPGGTITLRATQEEGFANISIQDTGIGIAPEQQAKVFDMFMQVDQSLERAQGGLGIGLTLVKTLIEMQGGTVEASSDGVNSGSTFTIRIPVLDQKIASFREKEAPESDDKICRVLVVDDNEDSARTMGWMLESLGHKTFLAYSGPEAIEIARKFHPHMILLDIGLPGMNGYEICQILRKEPALEKSVFVAQTGWGQPEHRKRSSAAGFDYHLVKPVESENLRKILASVP